MQSAIRSYPPAYDIRVEKIPIPKIEHPDDAIIKVKLAGLCGSDLHVYRGREGPVEPSVFGHEFIGEVTALGANFHPASTGRPHLYSTLKVGDKVVSPFTVSCGECHYCRVGFTCRCIQGQLFGTPRTPGGQAQYVRVPLAGGTLFNLEDISVASVNPGREALADSSLLLLCDILPTGVFAAYQALNHPKILPILTSRPYPQSSSGNLEGDTEVPLAPEDKVLTIALVGLGPVGVCTLIALLDMLYTKNITFRIVAIDPMEKRREKVKAIYTKVSNAYYGKLQNGHLEVSDIEASKETVTNWTNGIGCNSVLEAVGNTSALSLAYELVRPFGCITSVGVHANYQVPFTGQQLYNKNVSLDFGRCPVRAMFPMALDLLLRRQDIFGAVGGDASLVEKIVGFDVAAQTYNDFDKGRCGKVLFDPWR